MPVPKPKARISRNAPEKVRSMAKQYDGSTSFVFSGDMKYWTSKVNRDVKPLF